MVEPLVRITCGMAMIAAFMVTTNVGRHGIIPGATVR
jgi:hypothetical protein